MTPEKIEKKQIEQCISNMLSHKLNIDHTYFTLTDECALNWSYSQEINTTVNIKSISTNAHLFLKAFKLDMDKTYVQDGSERKTLNAYIIEYADALAQHKLLKEWESYETKKNSSKDLIEKYEQFNENTFNKNANRAVTAISKNISDFDHYLEVFVNRKIDIDKKELAKYEEDSNSESEKSPIKYYDSIGKSDKQTLQASINKNKSMIENPKAHKQRIEELLASPSLKDLASKAKSNLDKTNFTGKYDMEAKLSEIVKTRDEYNQVMDILSAKPKENKPTITEDSHFKIPPLCEISLKFEPKFKKGFNFSSNASISFDHMTLLKLTVCSCIFLLLIYLTPTIVAQFIPSILTKTTFLKLICHAVVTVALFYLALVTLEMIMPTEKLNEYLSIKQFKSYVKSEFLQTEKPLFKADDQTFNSENTLWTNFLEHSDNQTDQEVQSPSVPVRES